MLHLKNYFNETQQQALVELTRNIGSINGGMTVPVMPNGSKFNCSQTSCGLVGWLSDALRARKLRQGYRYSRINPVNNQPFAPMPTELVDNTLDSFGIETRATVHVVARIFGHNPVSGLPWGARLFWLRPYHESVGFATKKFWFFYGLRSTDTIFFRIRTRLVRKCWEMNSGRSTFCFVAVAETVGWDGCFLFLLLRLTFT
jgi:hypothetical protein